MRRFAMHDFSENHHATIARSASWLFVPGSRPERFDKAVRAGADQVVVDLEDAVTPARKESARDEVARWLGGAGEAWVRVNARGTQWHEHDLGALARRPGLRGVMVPKAEDPAALTGSRESSYRGRRSSPSSRPRSACATSPPSPPV